VHPLSHGPDLLKTLSHQPIKTVLHHTIDGDDMRTGPHPVMSLLAQRLPLTLLLDLRRPEGPDSEVLFLIEQPSGTLRPATEPHPAAEQAAPTA
jgi:hypothetical protein